jgi:hypothetical protein
MNRINSHLQSVDETYFQHMQHALSFVLDMLLGSLCCLVHAFLPFVFERKGSQIVTRLHDRMVVNRSNLTPARNQDIRRPEHTVCESEI